MKLAILFPTLCVALFWGLYGPALAQSRSALLSPFKPYLMIGLAYLVWGILGGIAGMIWKGDTFAFTGAGTVWGFIAGSLGAFGALALTLAMFAGGSRTPHVVMALVFGGAVAVAALYGVAREWYTEGVIDQNPGLWVGIVGILVSSIFVAYHTPQEHPPPRVAQSVASPPQR